MLKHYNNKCGRFELRVSDIGDWDLRLYDPINNTVVQVYIASYHQDGKKELENLRHMINQALAP